MWYGRVRKGGGGERQRKTDSGGVRREKETEDIKALTLNWVF